MSRIANVRGPGPHYYDASSTGSSEDFLYIAGFVYPDESITAQWDSIANCTVSNVRVDASKDIGGVIYSNVITARIGNFTAPLAETRLTISGVSSSQSKVRQLNVKICF